MPRKSVGYHFPLEVGEKETLADFWAKKPRTKGVRVPVLGASLFLCSPGRSHGFFGVEPGNRRKRRKVVMWKDQTLPALL